MDFLKEATALVMSAKKKVEKLRIRVGSKKYQQWLEWHANRSPKKPPHIPEPIVIKGIKRELEVKEAIPACECDACHGTGRYSNAKYTRSCFRCGGSGVIDSVKAQANQIYDFHRERGTLSTSYQDYENHGWALA